MDGRRKMDHTERYLSPTGASIVASCLVPERSIAVSCIGWQMGKAALTTRPSFTNQQLNTIIPNDDIVVPEFLYYAMSTRQTELKNLGSAGTRTPILNKSRFEALPVLLPPLPVQRRIADILSAYDDLIENNTKRIKILEEMARSLYREWFVNFRFSGREKVKLVASPIGKVPAGWELTKLEAVAAYINRGVAPKYAEDGAELVINQKCVRDQRLSLDPARRHCSTVPPDKYVKRGDVLINSTGVGTLGRVAQVLEELDRCTVDTHVSIVRPGSDIEPNYFGLVLFAKESYFATQGVGSTNQTELSRGRIGATEILVPQHALQHRYGEIVRPAREAAITLLQKNNTLRVTRDILLRRLISGEIDVSGLDPPSARWFARSVR
jgi:type I restriction enzyme, S subunit